jgi:hypothetical protein
MKVKLNLRTGQVWQTIGAGLVRVGRQWTESDDTESFEFSDGIRRDWYGAPTAGQLVLPGIESHFNLDQLVVQAPPVARVPVEAIPAPDVVSETPLERRAQQSALDVQVGGNHYKSLAIQPVEYCHRNGLGFCESSVVKYVTRWKAKNGVKDLEKARHFIDLLIEMERKQ